MIYRQLLFQKRIALLCLENILLKELHFEHQQITLETAYFTDCRHDVAVKSHVIAEPLPVCHFPAGAVQQRQRQRRVGVRAVDRQKKQTVFSAGRMVHDRKNRLLIVIQLYYIPQRASFPLRNHFFCQKT